MTYKTCFFRNRIFDNDDFSIEPVDPNLKELNNIDPIKRDQYDTLDEEISCFIDNCPWTPLPTLDMSQKIMLTPDFAELLDEDSFDEEDSEYPFTLEKILKLLKQDPEKRELLSKLFEDQVFKKLTDVEQIEILDNFKKELQAEFEKFERPEFIKSCETDECLAEAEEGIGDNRAWTALSTHRYSNEKRRNIQRLKAKLEIDDSNLDKIKRDKRIR